jgi:pimeloyl-ACP methyl ester carboxylesterase
MTSVLDQPELLQPVITLGRSRAIAAGVDPCEYDAITATLGCASDWTAAFRAAGAAHLAAARHADEDGHNVTAADAYLAAAASSHISTTVPTSDRAGHQEAAEAMAKALDILQPETISLISDTFHGTLRPQAADPAAPLVLVVPGLDSSRVEFHANAIALQRRGLATLTIDGPGQGDLAPATTLRADYHAVVTEALDAVLATKITPRAIGLMALSLGGYYGAQSLAREKRLSAGVLVSGPSALDWAHLPELLQEILTVRAGSHDAAHAFSETVDVHRFAAEITQPVLVIDGENDVIPGYSNGTTLARLAPGAEHLIIPEGDHLVGNRRWHWLPRAADYLREQLA